MNAWIESNHLTFTSNTHTHTCGTKQCLMNLITVNGVEVCPISGMQMGASIADATNEEDEVAVNHKRLVYVDPQNLNGGVDKTEIANDIYKKLFKHRVVDAKGLLGHQKQALVTAKNSGVDLKTRGLAIKNQVADSFITVAELDQLTRIAIHLSTCLEDRVEFSAVVCAVLNYAAHDGLTYKSQCFVERSARVEALMPHVRNFDDHGVKTAWVSIGSNAFTRSMDNLAPMEKEEESEHDMTRPLSICKKMRRLKF